MKKTTIILSTVAVFLLLISVLLAVAYGRLALHVAFAREQVHVFDSMRLEAMKSPPAEALGYLQYAANYYPSGSKQVPGSRLDAIVEVARSNAVREIIAYLRQRTGKDFGDAPNNWLDALKAKTRGSADPEAGR